MEKNQDPIGLLSVDFKFSVVFHLRFLGEGHLNIVPQVIKVSFPPHPSLLCACAWPPGGRGDRRQGPLLHPHFLRAPEATCEHSQGQWPLLP